MHRNPEITRLIHDKLWVVICFAFGQPAVGKVIQQKFQGEWPVLHKAVHELADVRADRALLEMATHLRVLDDAEDLQETAELPPEYALTQIKGVHANRA
jgi:hypothetical protein